jgi:hypothetical protein
MSIPTTKPLLKKQQLNITILVKLVYVDDRTKTMASESDKNNFDSESGVNAPWLRMKLGAMETQGGKERILEKL